MFSEMSHDYYCILLINYYFIVFPGGGSVSPRKASAGSGRGDVHLKP